MIDRDFSTSQGFLSIELHKNLLLLRIEEPCLGGECLNEMLFLAIRDSIASHAQATAVAISFANVNQLTSLTVSVLLRAERYATKQGMSMQLCEMRPGIRNVFKILHLDGTKFTITESPFDVLSQHVRPSLLDAYGTRDSASLTELDW